MNFTIEKEAFSKALGRAAGVVDKGPSIAMSGAVLLGAGPDGLVIRAHGKSMSLTDVHAATVAAHGSVAVDVANLHGVVKALPSGPLEVTLTGKEQTVVQIVSGRSTYKVTGSPAAEYPPAVDEKIGEPVVVTAGNLRDLIDRMVFAIAPDDNRYGLNGAHVERSVVAGQSFLRLVGTDGNRLSWSEVPCVGVLDIANKQVIPRRALETIRRLLDKEKDDVEVTIGFADRAMLATFGSTRFQVRLFEADFPDYRQVIPTTFKVRAVVDREELVAAIKRVSVMTENSKAIKASFKRAPDGSSAGTLTLTARKLDKGDARDEVAVEVSEDLDVGFNPDFLLDALVAVDETVVVLNMGASLSPVIVRGDGAERSLHVVMPIRLD